MQPKSASQPQPQPVTTIRDLIALRASLGNPIALAFQRALNKPVK